MTKKLKRVLIKYSSLFLLFLLNLADSSCKQNEPAYVYQCQDGFIEFQNITTLKFIENLTLNDSLATLVIQSEEQLDKYFLNTRGKFDFSKNTVLAGRYRAANEDAILKQTIKSFCEYNVLYYDIQMKSGMLPSQIKVPFFALIPKIPDNATVQFHVHY
ncbi:hypothetical protein [Dyadobacter frigoris]|uniref:Lipoprotein n=1 Tax=Dyadobacter frigoris TaxID=2576211 RepID=A0A4U6D8V4_9BACT|nr:hypothetical protein [Dyadobacter frigoris]TKT92791.1 hypothetical protein FDK13_08280 [Dyadobacter frigoris]GLU54502.1 hypothetical protein Dfri01_39630 [Dyadobacter frigoris]